MTTKTTKEEWLRYVNAPWPAEWYADGVDVCGERADGSSADVAFDPDRIAALPAGACVTIHAGYIHKGPVEVGQFLDEHFAAWRKARKIAVFTVELDTTVSGEADFRSYIARFAGAKVL